MKDPSSNNTGAVSSVKLPLLSLHFHFLHHLWALVDSSFHPVTEPIALQFFPSPGRWPWSFTSTGTYKRGDLMLSSAWKNLKERKSHLKSTIMVPNSHQKLAEPKLTLTLITAFFSTWTAARHLKQHFITMLVLLLVMIYSWDHIRSRSNLLLVSRL